MDQVVWDEEKGTFVFGRSLYFLHCEIYFELPKHLSDKYLDSQFHDKPWVFRQQFKEEIKLRADGFNDILTYRNLLVKISKHLQLWIDFIDHIIEKKKKT